MADFTVFKQLLSVLVYLVCMVALEKKKKKKIALISEHAQRFEWGCYVYLYVDSEIL